MNKHEPIRHHYVPRFLLKPFCFEYTKINYYDKTTGEVSVKDTKDIFVEKYFYRDDINNEDDPMKLENDLARFERDISSIIRKFLKDDEIIVTTEEYKMLQMFFAVMLYTSGLIPPLSRSALLSLLSASFFSKRRSGCKNFGNSLTVPDFSFIWI